jgi:hypothetical protein
VAEPPPFCDLTCVVHLHSTYSDGSGTVPEIARAARRAGVDVVLLTDHDTLEAKARGEEGWYGGDVLVLAGHEVSPGGGNHYLAFGTDRPIDHAGLDACGICAAVRDAGGFGFAAHPWSHGSSLTERARPMPFRGLDCETLHGVELWSFLTDTAEPLTTRRGALRLLLAPGRAMRHPPAENLREWDRLCAGRPVPAVGGVDAHQIGRRIGPIVVRLMGYKRSFRTLRTHVLAERALTGELAEDEGLVFDPLRSGRSYIAADIVAPASGFAFWAEGDSGSVSLGESAAAAAGQWLRVRLPAPGRVRLLKDGRETAGIEGEGLEVRAAEPGVYRVEVYRRARGAERTWILSNPIYLR